MLNTETSPCAFELNRNGPFGEAPVLTTYARRRTGWIAMAASWFGKAPVGVVKVWGFVEATAGTWPGPGASRPFELNPVFASGPRTIGFGAPRGSVGRGRDRHDAALALVILALVDARLPRPELAEEERDEDGLVDVVAVPVVRDADRPGGRPEGAEVDGGHRLGVRNVASKTIRLFEAELAT